jgi:hypothetical protein
MIPTLYCEIRTCTRKGAGLFRVLPRGFRGRRATAKAAGSATSHAAASAGAAHPSGPARAWEANAAGGENSRGIAENRRSGGRPAGESIELA